MRITRLLDKDPPTLASNGQEAGQLQPALMLANRHEEQITKLQASTKYEENITENVLKFMEIQYTTTM